MENQNRYIGKDFYEVKNELLNGGCETKKLIYTKKINLGLDQYNNNTTLTIEISEIDKSTETIFNKDHKILYIGNPKETINHKKIMKYKTLSISGNNACYGGQIQDNLKFYLKKNKNLKRIIQIWKAYHLNDMCPNCIHQKGFNCNIKSYDKRAVKETLKCPKKYKYGSKWLIQEIPTSILIEVIGLFEIYNK